MSNISEEDQKWNSSETFANLIDINNLKYDTQYALAVKAKTESGLESVKSETVLVWTEPSTSVVLSPPIIEPSGPVLEGEMLTLRCDATGSPIPTISLFINGVLAKTEVTRHLVYKLDYVQRNLTALSCQASNDVIVQNESIFPAQSHTEVRVRCESFRVFKNFNKIEFVFSRSQNKNR